MQLPSLTPAWLSDLTLSACVSSLHRGPTTRSAGGLPEVRRGFTTLADLSVHWQLQTLRI